MDHAHETRVERFVPRAEHQRADRPEISFSRSRCRATFEITPAEFRLQPFGVVHGGNIATLIDSAAFWACYLSMGSDDDGLASVDLKTHEGVVLSYSYRTAA